MLVKLVHPSNARAPILVALVIITFFNDVGTSPKIYLKRVSLLPSPINGKVILVKPVQPLNTDSPIIVTLFGISMLVKHVQPENAEEPILITLFGSSIFAILVHPSNAAFPICVILLDKIIFFIFILFLKDSSFIPTIGSPLYSLGIIIVKALISYFE